MVFLGANFDCFEAIAMTDADEEIWEVLKQRKHELPYDPYMHELPIVPSCNVPKVHVEAIKVLGSVTQKSFSTKVSGSAGRCGFLQCDRIKSSLLNPQGRLLVRHGINLVGFYHVFI